MASIGVILQGVFDVDITLGTPQSSVVWAVVSDQTWNSLTGTWDDMGVYTTTFDVEEVLGGSFNVNLALQGALGDGAMTVNGQSFALYVGESRNITIKVVDGSGNPFNLVGSTITWTLVDQRGKTVLTKSPSGDSSGNITFTLTHADTQTLESAKYAHFTQVTDSSGNVAVVTSGNLTLLTQ